MRYVNISQVRLKTARPVINCCELKAVFEPQQCVSVRDEETDQIQSKPSTHTSSRQHGSLWVLDKTRQRTIPTTSNRGALIETD